MDSSAPAVEMARRNATLNGHKNIEFACADVFDYLKSCREKFDLIHIDPPPFAKAREGIASALKGYEKLCASALSHLKDGGVLFISTCSHHISERMLEETVIKTFKKSGRGAEVTYRGIQDSDHPVLKGFPESLYLKGLAIRG